MRILFYFNSNSEFYSNLFYSIKRGFEEAQCIVEGEPKVLDSDTLRKKILSFQPDFVLEINRTKSEIDNFPEDVLHVSWLFDLWETEPKDMYSDIIYTFGYSWLKRFPKTCAKYITCLPPATDESIYKPINIEKKFDFSFFGHIPKPWKEDELNRKVGYQDTKPILFKDILSGVESALLSQKNPFLSNSNRFSFKLFQKKHNFKFIPNLSNSLQYDITARIFRLENRLRFLNLIKETSDNISIYGTNWEQHKDFKRFFKGYITSPHDINKAIQSSKVMLHDNHNFHFRILDSMAGGIPVTMTVPKKTNDNLELFGLKKDIHYLEVDVFNKKPFSLPSKKQLNYISINAINLVKERHLWKHRAETILNDVSKLLNCNTPKHCINI